jgi:hypothetical protein
MMSLDIIQQFEERQKQLEQRLEEQSLLIKEQILQNESLRQQLGHALTHAQAPQGIQYATTESSIPSTTSTPNAPCIPCIPCMPNASSTSNALSAPDREKIWFLSDLKLSESPNKLEPIAIPTQMFVSTDAKEFKRPQRPKHMARTAVAFLKDFERAPLLHIFVQHGRIDVACGQGMPNDLEGELKRVMHNVPTETNKAMVPLMKQATKLGHAFLPSRQHTVKTYTLDAIIDALTSIEAGEPPNSQVKKVVEAFTAKEQGARKELIRVLGRFRPKKRNEIVKGLRGFKGLLAAARKAMFVPPELLKYLRDLRGEYDRQRMQSDQMEYQAEVIASLYKNELVSKEQLLSARRDDVGTFGLKAGDSGLSVSSKCKARAEALQGALLAMKITDESGVVNRLHKYNNTARAFQRDVNKAWKQKVQTTVTKQDLKEVEAMAKAYVPIPDFNSWDQAFDARKDLQIVYKGGGSKHRSRQSLYKDMQKSTFYHALAPLWKLREHFHVTTWMEFLQFLVSENAKEWVLMLTIGDSVAHLLEEDNTSHDEKFTAELLGSTTAGPVIDLLVDIADRMGTALTKYIQVLLVPMVSWWFSCRQMICIMIHVVSEQDYEDRKKLAKEFGIHGILNGLWIVVGDGYTIIKRESKTRMGKHMEAPDFELSERQLDRYPHLRKFLPKIVRAYEELTDSKVTPTSIEQRNYISNYRLGTHKYNGKYLVLKDHMFPMKKIASKGSGFYLQVNKDIGRTPLFVDESVEELLDMDKSSGSRLSSSHVAEVYAKRVTYYGDTCGTSGIKPMKGYNFPHESFFVPGTPKRASHDTVRKAMDCINIMWKSAINGHIVFPRGHFGKLKPVKYSINSEHLDIAKDLTLNYKYLGRYNRSNVLVQVIKYLKEFIQNKDFIQYLETKKQQIMREENHLTEAVVDKAYEVFKGTLKDFASITSNKYDDVLVDRLASHDRFPWFRDGPTTFVKHEPTEGSLKYRCKNMKHLTYLEQSAQMLFISCYLELYKCICEYKRCIYELDGATIPMALSELRNGMEKNMRLAQNKHRKPFWSPIFNEMSDKVTHIMSCVSPKCCGKRKREDMPM